MPEQTNASLFQRGRAVIPGGVNSPVRAFNSVGGTPYFVERGQGAYVWDVEGRKYIDYVQSWGASIVGHAHPHVVAAIRSAAENGTSFGAPTAREVLLAEEVAKRVSGCEMVRLVSSGTEATMSAIRLARGFTKRDRILKFDGCYHGHSDSLLAAGGSGVSTLGIPGSAGVPASSVAATVVAPYNVVPDISDDVACVIVEPVAANMGLVPPVPGFLEGLRSACDRAGALLIFDEVITGFRLGSGGASEMYGVRPDLWCFGKVIGGGLPVGAFAGRKDVMEHLAPIGEVYQAGTLSGNPLATAAGLAVFELLDSSSYEKLHALSKSLASQMRAVIESVGVSAQVVEAGPLLGFFFGNEPISNHDDAKRAASTNRYPAFFHSMLDQGIALPPSPFEVFFPGLAHSEDDLEITLKAFHKSLVSRE